MPIARHPLPVPLTPASPPSLTSLHLLRALLREASYLPDANARQYFRRYIVDRFRAYRVPESANGPATTPAHRRAFRRRRLSITPDAIEAQRIRSLDKKAGKGLALLRRANHGEISCLQKILYFTYGRIGKRKYILLEQLLRPNEELEPGSAPLQKLYYSDQRFLQYFDAPKEIPRSDNHAIHISDTYSLFRTVVKSQCQNGISLNGLIRRHFLKTPIRNVWMRPMPIKRARNNVRRWYADTMTKLLPPLPEQEWDHLQAIISGEKPISLAKRRTPASVHIFSEPSRKDEDLFQNRIYEALALDKPNRADRPVGAQGPHSITPRFMRRIYSRLFSLCCKLESNEKRNQLVAVWGNQTAGYPPQTHSKPIDGLLFDGVSPTGKMLKAPKDLKQSLASSSFEPQFEAEIDPETEWELEMKSKSKSAGNGKQKYMYIPFYLEYLPASHPKRIEFEEYLRRRKLPSQSTESTTVAPGR